jgi:hypothetical protein
VSSRGDRPDAWGGTDAAAASGGHLPPEIDATGPLFDPLTSPLPDETQGDGWERVQPQRRSAETVPYAPTQETRPAPPPRRPAQTRSGAKTTRTRTRPRTPLRRVKRTLRHVDPVSVLKVSLIYYACLLIIWLIIVAIIFSFLKSLGLFDQIDSVAKGLKLGRVEITLGVVEKWAFLVGATLTVLGSLVNVFLAFLYNAISDAVGGVEMTFVERDVSETRN